MGTGIEVALAAAFVGSAASSFLAEKPKLPPLPEVESAEEVAAREQEANIEAERESLLRAQSKKGRQSNILASSGNQVGSNLLMGG